MPPPNFTTPGGRPVTLTVRDGTADWNTCQSTLTEDEYHLAGLSLSGYAIDVGAYVGSVTVGLLLDHPDLHVIAVEPLPENLDIIRENLARYGLADRCTLMRGAFGTDTIYYDFDGDDGTVDDFADQHRYIGNAEGHFTLSAGHTGRKVKVPRLYFDDLLPTAELTLAKLDCEGGEWGFFEGDMSHVERIVGEWHPTLTDGWLGPEAELEKALGKTHDVDLLEHETFRAVRR